MGAIIGVYFLLFFACINFFWWGDSGQTIHFLGHAISEYQLIWIWIGLLFIIIGSSFIVDGCSKNPIWAIICLWWMVNIGAIEVLNQINLRPIESEGEIIFGFPGIILDFIVQAPLDLTGLMIIWALINRELLEVSMGILIFCGFLVANLSGYAFSAYNLTIGVSAKEVAQFYDPYICLVFTLMLTLQALGSGLDALLRGNGSNVDIYIDLRPYLRRFVVRYLRLP